MVYNDHSVLVSMSQVSVGKPSEFLALKFLCICLERNKVMFFRNSIMCESDNFLHILYYITVLFDYLNMQTNYITPGMI